MRGLIVAGVALAAVFVALLAGREIARRGRRRHAALAARYQPLVDSLLSPGAAGVAMAELLRAPIGHRPVIGTLLLGLLRITSGEAIEYARALIASLGLRDAWRAQLSAGRPALRTEAARALGIIRDPSSAASLVDLLQDPVEPVRLAALSALGAIADPTTLPSLVAALSRPERFPRAAIDEALSRFAESAAPAVIAYARQQPRFAAVLIDAVGRAGSGALVDDLIPWMADDRHDVRAAAIGACGLLGMNERAYYHTLKALGDEDAAVRLAAARALGRSGRQDAIPYLAAHLDGDTHVAAECAAALQRLSPEPRS